jgi:hypothetical protein
MNNLVRIMATNRLRTEVEHSTGMYHPETRGNEQKDWNIESMMKAECSSRTLISISETLWCHSPTAARLNTHSCEHLKM